MQRGYRTDAMNFWYFLKAQRKWNPHWRKRNQMTIAISKRSGTWGTDTWWKDCRGNMFFSYYLVMKLTVFILCVNEEGLMLKWHGGPSLPEIPFPIPDPARPWGGECDKCTSSCYGHFLPPKECVEHIRQLGMKDCMLTLQQSSRKHLRSPRRVKPPFQAWR